MQPAQPPIAAPRQRNSFALLAIALGLVAVVPLFWIMLTEGARTSGGSGSGRLYADGSVIRSVQEPTFSFADFVRLAFLLCLGSLILSLVSFARRERPILSLCALSYGLAPLFMYLWLGFIIGALPPLAFTAALAAVALCRKLRLSG